MPKKSNPRTIADCIEAVGGVREAAKAWGTTVENVCNWRAMGHFPARKFFLVNASFPRRGRQPTFPVPPSLFKMDEPPSNP